MKRHLLLFGTLAGLLFFGTVYALAYAVPGYSHVSDTVSEIGQVGSPVERLFQVAMLAVNLCIVAFGLGLFYFARSREASIVPAAFCVRDCTRQRLLACDRAYSDIDLP